MITHYFILSTDILTLMKICFLVMKGKRCNNKNKTERVMDVEQVFEQHN